jgi:hypothetical protein
LIGPVIAQNAGIQAWVAKDFVAEKRHHNECQNSFRAINSQKEFWPFGPRFAQTKQPNESNIELMSALNRCQSKTSLKQDLMSFGVYLS